VEALPEAAMRGIFAGRIGNGGTVGSVVFGRGRFTGFGGFGGGVGFNEVPFM
jgi:hypothetical protein